MQTASAMHLLAKQANFRNIGAREILFDSLDGGEDGEHTGVSLVEISTILAMQNTNLFWNGTEYHCTCVFRIISYCDFSCQDPPPPSSRDGLMTYDSVDFMRASVTNDLIGASVSF